MRGKLSGPALLVMTIVALAPLLATAQATPDATPPQDTGPRFVLRPSDDVDGSYFTVQAEPGSTQTLKVLLANANSAPMELRTYAADAFTLVNGGFGVREESDPSDGVANWLAYEAQTLSLDPGKGIEREFTVTVPEGTSPGQYIAGIVLQTAAPIPISGSSMLEQIVRKSIAVFITVPGETKADFTLGSPSIEVGGGAMRLAVPVVNDGNVLVRPTGTLRLADAQGKDVFTQQVSMGSVYAGTRTTLELPLPPTLPDATYTLTVNLADEATSARASLPATSVATNRPAQEQYKVTLADATITPMPSVDAIQFASVAVTISNPGVVINGARLTLRVSHDGQPVEDFTLANAVALQQGDTRIEQRYLPFKGWSAGEWRFAFTLQAIDPQTGAQTTILNVPIEQTITIDG